MEDLAKYMVFCLCTSIKAAVVTAKTGNLITVRALEEDTNEVLMISTKGQTIRVGVKDIPVIGRTTQGVRVMRLNEDDTVASIGLIGEEPVEEGDEE